MDNLALYAFDHFGDALLQYACCCTGSRPEAEDIVQDVLLALHASPPKTISDDDHLQAWLFCAIRNRARNYHRSWWKQKRSDIAPADEPRTASPEENAALLDIIYSLPKPYASVLYLYYVQRYSIKDIAKVQRKSENTIGSLLRRGRQKLKLKLESEEVADL